MDRVRAALRTLRKAYGTWSCLADAMGVARNTVENVANGHSNASPAMALRVAKAANVTLEELLGPIGSVIICPTCGARKGAR